MKPGEEFEYNCYKYLKDFYKNQRTDFRHEGSMDSTKSDIAVIKNGKIDFYIEVKEALAQSGQFVLLPNQETETFTFSPKNKSCQNEMTNTIIKYMNNDFLRFYKAGTAGQCLDIDEDIFANWIVNHYKSKNVKYIMSYNNGYVILPIRKFQQYFDVIATYRIKKSGSRSPAKKDIDILKKHITHFYHTSKFYLKDKKLFIEINEPFSTEKFVIGDYTYFLSKQETGNYEVRKLSNTYNMNVIFSIKIKKAQDKMDLEEFEAEL